jgi:hypothetical protein
MACDSAKAKKPERSGPAGNNSEKRKRERPKGKKLYPKDLALLASLDASPTLKTSAVGSVTGVLQSIEDVFDELVLEFDKALLCLPPVGRIVFERWCCDREDLNAGR